MDKIFESTTSIGSWVFRLISIGGFALLLYICNSTLSEIKTTSTQVSMLSGRIEVMDKVWNMQNDIHKSQLTEIKTDLKSLDSRVKKLERNFKD